MKKHIKIFAAALSFAALTFCSCREKNPYTSIAVFIPGIIQGSPTYEHVVEGVKAAVENAMFDIVTSLPFGTK